MDDRLETTQHRMDKIEADIKLLYERHDNAKFDVEKEAAWRRTVELTGKLKQLKQQPEKPKPKPQKLNITHNTIAKYLESMNKLMGKTNDKGKAFVQSVVEHHGLTVQMRDAQTIIISLQLRPPGSETDLQSRYLVPLKREVRLPMDKITAWVEDNQDKHKCKCGCGGIIPIRRQMCWTGIPQYHGDCRHKAMQSRRAKLAEGCYTGLKPLILPSSVVTVEWKSFCGFCTGTKYSLRCNFPAGFFRTCQ